MSAWDRIPLACLLVSLCGASMAAPPRTKFEQSFIGREWTPESPNFLPYPLADQCEQLACQDIQRSQKLLVGFSIDLFRCDGRELFLFEQSSGGREARVIDALLLPQRKPGEDYLTTGDCELDGNTDTDFIALVHLGRREKVDWKTGVRAAWVPTPETGKVEELPIRHVVCWRPTPP